MCIEEKKRLRNIKSAQKSRIQKKEHVLHLHDILLNSNNKI